MESQASELKRKSAVEAAAAQKRIAQMQVGEAHDRRHGPRTVRRPRGRNANQLTNSTLVMLVQSYEFRG